MTKQALSEQKVEAALRDINKLADEEYGLTLKDLLESPMAEKRLQRLAGIILKEPFAKATGPGPCNPTGARRSWQWDDKQLDSQRRARTPQYKLLKNLRDTQVNGDWSSLHEAGLMYVLGKWLKGRLAGEEKTFRQYYDEPTSSDVALVLNVANLLPAASALAGVVGLPVLAVNLALILTKFGYEKLTELDTQSKS